MPLERWKEAKGVFGENVNGVRRLLKTDKEVGKSKVNGLSNILRKSRRRKVRRRQRIGSARRMQVNISF